MERKKLSEDEIWVLEVLKIRESYSTFVEDIVKGTDNWISINEARIIVEKLKGVKYLNHDAGDHSNLSISNTGKKELAKIEADKLADFIYRYGRMLWNLISRHLG